MFNKNHHNRAFNLLYALLLAIVFISSCRSSEFNLPSELQGNWKATRQKVTVRTEPRWMHFEFTNDSCEVQIAINADKTVFGKIGEASFSGTLKKNSGNAEKTGVAYIVECGKVGKLFEQDPLESKELELWLSPIQQDMKAEIRCTEGMGAFPMASIVFAKEKE